MQKLSEQDKSSYRQNGFLIVELAGWPGVRIMIDNLRWKPPAAKSLGYHLDSGPIYSRYKRLGDDRLGENFFPVLWREDGYRSPQITDYLRA